MFLLPEKNRDCDYRDLFPAAWLLVAHPAEQFTTHALVCGGAGQIHWNNWDWKKENTPLCFPIKFYPELGVYARVGFSLPFKFGLFQQSG